MNPKISIIIPVYKAEKTIQRCLSSLLNQTLAEFEIIVVDDKGGDNTITIVEDIKQTHQRGDSIKIVEMPKNSGAALARNYGMREARGEYIAFVDSDDWCESFMYESLYNEAKRNNTDFSYCQALKELPDGKTKVLKLPYVEPGIISDEKRAFMLKHFVAYFWTGIYKKDFLVKERIEFPNVRYSEDSFFIWMVILTANRFSSLDKIGYHYIIYNDSVSNTLDKTKYLVKIELYRQLLKEIKARGLYEKFQQDILFLYFKKAYLIPLFIYISETKKLNRDNIQQINVSFRQSFPNVRIKNSIIACFVFLFDKLPLFMALLIKNFKLYRFIRM